MGLGLVDLLGDFHVSALLVVVDHVFYAGAGLPGGRGAVGAVGGAILGRGATRCVHLPMMLLLLPICCFIKVGRGCGGALW